jgi:hypothetical protein
MDPNATLAELRTMAAQIIELEDSDSDESEQMIAEIAIDLAERVQALDQWIARGGFLPLDWAQGR